MRQAERRARTRAALLDAAAEVFASRGYENASIDAIAASVGLSKGAVYAHFATKLDLYLAVVQAELAEGETRLARVLESLETGGSLDRAADAYFGSHDDARHGRLMAEAWRTATMEPAVAELVNGYLERRQAALGGALVTAGRNPQDALRLAETVGRILDGALLQRQLKGSQSAGQAG